MTKEFSNINSQLFQFKNYSLVKLRNRSITRQKVRIAKGLPRDFFKPIKTEQQTYQYQYNDDGLKTPSFREQNGETRYKPLFPNRKQVSYQVPKVQTLKLRKKSPTKLYFNKQQINRLHNNSREKPNSFRQYLNQYKESQLKQFSSHRQQIKFKTKLNIDIVCTDILQDSKQKKIRKNVFKFFAEGNENIKKPNCKSEKLPLLLI